MSEQCEKLQLGCVRFSMSTYFLKLLVKKSDPTFSLLLPKVTFY